jgi:small ligand-binding sensory domain FIST
VAPVTSVMRWASATSTLTGSVAAAEAVANMLAASLAGDPADLVLAFFSTSHVAGAGAIAETLRRRLAPANLLGASAHGIVSTEHEIESGAALTVMAAHLPGVTLAPFVVAQEGWTEALEDPLAFARATPNVADAELVILLGDPFSLDLEPVLAAFHRHAPSVRIVGGMASAGARPGANALFLNDWEAKEGGVAIALRGALRADVVVSQGCRPLGPPLRVSSVDGNLLLELDGMPALERVEQVLRELTEAERERLRHGLYIGRPVRRNATGQGDYLIRNLLGADRDRGALAVGDVLPEGESVRLHVRDAETAREDLELLLSPQVVDSRAHAALLFLCNGRGRGLYGAPDGDLAPLQSALGGGVPAAGMSCAGEIGPVGGRNFLHGHTASIALIRPR